MEAFMLEKYINEIEGFLHNAKDKDIEIIIAIYTIIIEYRKEKAKRL